jgi:hypothetical protein
MGLLTGTTLGMLVASGERHDNHQDALLRIR